jgi:cardiolipin synthase
MRTREPLATIPNLISLSRLGMAGLFIIFDGREQRLLLIAGAATTDFLDGYIARSSGLTSKWGALIDAIADRFFVFAAICSLLFDGTLSTWQYVVFISRDFMTAVGFLTARIIPWLRAVPFKSRPAGRIVTVVQLSTLTAIYLVPGIVTPLLAVLGVVSLYSIVDYTVALYHARDRG